MKEPYLLQNKKQFTPGALYIYLFIIIYESIFENFKKKKKKCIKYYFKEEEPNNNFIVFFFFFCINLNTNKYDLLYNICQYKTVCKIRI